MILFKLGVVPLVLLALATAPPDDSTRLAVQVAASTVLGWLVQKLIRANTSVPTWLTWPAIGAAAVGLYVWSDYEALSRLQLDWRAAVLQLYAFALQVRGAAATSKDTKAAGATATT